MFSGVPSQIYGRSGVDPQIVWDPGTRRFFFAALTWPVQPGELRWGFSRSDSPNGPADWCTYADSFDYGNAYPDYPRLGTTKDFVLVGANRLDVAAYAGYGHQSDLMWWTKPPRGATCPPASSFRKGIAPDLRNADHSEAFTPLPARQVDSKSTGWVLATHTFVGNTITVFSVTKSPTGNAVVSGPRTLPIARYGVPNVAPEPGTGLDGQPAPPVETLDARLTQATAAVDPRFGHVDIWTAHTVAGGAGSQARWYEIDPTRPGLDQSGELTDPHLQVFNATVAPDRAVDRTRARFGSSMVVEANTSSATSPISIVVASKRGAAAQSVLRIVRRSRAGNQSAAACSSEIRHACPWGDFSGSSPDPLGSPDHTQGQVWITNTWVDTSHLATTWNASLTPTRRPPKTAAAHFARLTTGSDGSPS